MRKFTTSFSAVLLPVFIAIVLAACGSSPGGSGYGGSSDTTPPVTTANPAGSTVSQGDFITFTCTDDSSGCRETWLSGELSGAAPWFLKVYDIDVSGSLTSYTVEISGTHTVGATYDYQFYSIDNANNREITKTEVYLIQ